MAAGLRAGPRVDASPNASVLSMRLSAEIPRKLGEISLRHLFRGLREGSSNDGVDLCASFAWAVLPVVARAAV